MYQVHSLIEMVEMCKSTDTASAFNTDILSITNRKFLNLKYLESHKPVQNNWEERLSLKYKGFIAAAKLIEDKEKLMQKYNQQQKIFTQKLLEISKRWKIIQQGNNIFAVVGKNFQGEDYKVMLLKDPESGIKVEMANELKKLKVLKVTVFCPEISLNEVQLPKSFGFEDLEKAEQLLIDGEISKEIHEKITENKEYSIQKYTKNEVVLLVNVRIT